MTTISLPHYSSLLITGNLAIDFAIIILALLGAKYLITNVVRYTRRALRARERNQMLSSELSHSHEKISTLRNDLSCAREQTQKMMSGYLEDLDHRARVASAMAEAERDPLFSDLEHQLDQARSKPRHH